MSGHSKWSTIKRKKAVTDAKRGKIFTKVGRAITVAVKKGGADPDSNATLRTAIEKARQVRMPKDNIDRAIKRGSGGGEDGNLEEIRYEGYGPEGVALMIEALTDNRNRTVSDIRNVLTKYGGSLGESGSTAYIFGMNPGDPKFKVTAKRPDKILEFLDELSNLTDVQEVFTNYDNTGS